MNPGPAGAAPPKSKISGYKQHQISNYTPGQMNIFESLLGSLLPGIQGSGDFLAKLAGGDESMFQQLEAPANTQFQKLLGSIGTRFSDLGAQDSSYFENALAGEGAQMAERLQAQRLGLRSQAINALLGQSNQLLGAQPYSNLWQPKKPKQGTDWGGIGQLGGTVLGGLGGGFFGGPAGAAAGAQFGGQLGRAGGSAFNR